MHYSLPGERNPKRNVEFNREGEKEIFSWANPKTKKKTKRRLGEPKTLDKKKLDKTFPLQNSFGFGKKRN